MAFVDIFQTTRGQYNSQMLYIRRFANTHELFLIDKFNSLAY